LLLAAASLAGITATIVIASRSADEYLRAADDRVLNVPVKRTGDDDARAADHPASGQ
jgi:hypothetical protein